MPKQNTMTVSS